MTERFRCLAIESATTVCSLAIGSADDCLQQALPAGPQRSRPVYLSMEAGWPLASLDCIAFGCGPGAFTGLRVAAAVAQALAYGAGLPVCRISSLAVLAQGAVRRYRATRVAACLDARMGEIYAGCYASDGAELRLVGSECVTVPDEFALPGEGRYLAAGPGWAVAAGLASRLAGRLSAVQPGLLPTARDLLVCAAADFASGRTAAAADAQPNYLRNEVTG